MFFFPEPDEPCLSASSNVSSATTDGQGGALKLLSPAHVEAAHSGATATIPDDDLLSDQHAFSYSCFSQEDVSCSAQRRVVDAAASSGGHDWEALGPLLARQAELRASCHYLHQHPQHTAPGAFLTPHMRMIVTSWMAEVVEELGLHNTLHLAVALFDRFLSCTQGVPSGALQLLAVACILVAGKLHEVRHPLVQQLTGIGANSFEAKDLLRVERILLDTLNFRLELPTSNLFVHLYAQGLPSVHPAVLCTALYFTELALLDYSMLPYAQSCVAASALSLAMLCHGLDVPCSCLSHLSGCAPKELRQCAQELQRLHAAAAWPVSAEAKALLRPLRVKYAQKRWCGAAHTLPIAALPFTLFRE